MSIRSILGCAILFCISLTGSGQNIALDDSLAAHAEMYKVKTKPGGMGKVMKILLPKVSGAATPDRVSAIVKRLLS